MCYAGDVKKRICIIFGLFISCAANAVPAVVDYVVDGDTFAARVNIDKDVAITTRVRIMDIDTPEIHGQCASEIKQAKRAKEKLAALMPKGTTVELKNIKDDKYLGRIDADVFLPDGKSVGNVMVRSALARPYDGGRRAGWCK